MHLAKDCNSTQMPNMCHCCWGCSGEWFVINACQRLKQGASDSCGTVCSCWFMQKEFVFHDKNHFTYTCLSSADLDCSRSRRNKFCATSEQGLLHAHPALFAILARSLRGMFLYVLHTLPLRDVMSIGAFGTPSGVSQSLRSNLEHVGCGLKPPSFGRGARI